MFEWFRRKKKYNVMLQPVEEGCEILRAAIGPVQNLHVVIKALGEDAEDHNGQWGIALADIAQHASDLCETEFGVDRNKALIRIREVFNNELDDPTSPIIGHTIC